MKNAENLDAKELIEVPLSSPKNHKVQKIIQTIRNAVI
jgi:hypothetical protein